MTSRNRPGRVHSFRSTQDDVDVSDTMMMGDQSNTLLDHQQNEIEVRHVGCLLADICLYSKPDDENQYLLRDFEHNAPRGFFEMENDVQGCINLRLLWLLLSVFGARFLPSWICSAMKTRLLIFSQRGFRTWRFCLCVCVLCGSFLALLVCVGL